jgi:ABC-type protease/lipase transport system fused ATPase/permease subunit
MPRRLKKPVSLERSELAAAHASCRGAFVATGSTGAMFMLEVYDRFMLEVYDRVLPSRSVPTLIGLAVLAGGLYVALGLLDLIRGRILARIGISLDETLSARIYHTIVRLPAMVGMRNDSAAPMRDLDTVRAFLGGVGPIALFDLPWMPVYLGICFAFHFWIGMTATVGAFILVVLTVVTEWLVLKPTRMAAQLAQARNTMIEAAKRNSEALVAMGMLPHLMGRWTKVNADCLASNCHASDTAGGLGALSKVVCMMLQSGQRAFGGRPH